MTRNIHDILTAWILPADGMKITVSDWTSDPENPPATVTLAEDTAVRHYMISLFRRQAYYEDTNDFDALVNSFAACWYDYITREQDNIDRMYNVLIAEYDPISNYDRHEDSSTTRTGSWTDAMQHGLTVTDTKGQYKTDTDIAAFDGVKKPTSTVQQGHVTGNSDTSGYTGTDTRTITHNSDKDTFKSYIHGNIGITTSQAMATSELQLRQFDLMEEIIKKFVRTYCFTWYGEECD